uniref:SAM-dependent methyltransferase n=1 Tax=Nonomuraea sp. CA-252377 TaxID=3240003 RepID=UPI003F493154
MSQPAWANGVDPTKVSAARMYDAALDGSHNFEVDRAAVAAIAAVTPYYVPTIQENRNVLQRMVRYLRSQGVTQFLDIGAGLPTRGQVHEIADNAKVVYVDNDPEVIAHAEALMAGTDRVRIVEGDAREPDDILAHRDVSEFLDRTSPIALLLIGVLHFIPDDEVYKPVDRFKAALGPGNLIAITHGTTDGFDPAWNAAVEHRYESARNRPHMRSYEAIEPFFAGCDMIPPGLVNVMHWRPDSDVGAHPPEHIGLYGGIGRIQPGRR